MEHNILIKCRALVGDKVLVGNYRKRPIFWEEGIVILVEARIGSIFGENPKNVSVHYTVRTKRETKSGNPVFLHVGDDKIMPIQ